MSQMSSHLRVFKFRSVFVEKGCEGGQFGSSGILPRILRGGMQFPTCPSVKLCLRESLRGAGFPGGPGNLHTCSGLWLQLLERHSNGSDLLSEPLYPHLQTGVTNTLCARLARDQCNHSVIMPDM